MKHIDNLIKIEYCFARGKIMRKIQNYIFLVISIFLFSSCGNRNSTNHSNISGDNTVNTSSQICPDTPSHMVISHVWVRLEPNNTSRLIQIFPRAMLVSLLATENVAGTYWARIVNSRGVTGWFHLNMLKKIDQSLVGLAMNEINDPVIILPNKEGENYRFILDGEYGRFSYEYGMNRIVISYFRKGIVFDDDFNLLNDYCKERFLEIETSIANQFDIFPNYRGFNDKRRKNIKNNVVFFDSFRFTEFTLREQRLARDIFFTTNDYNIRIKMSLPDEIMNIVMREAPNYFEIVENPEELYATIITWDFSEENIEKGYIFWRSEAPEQFGTDLLNNTNQSETAIAWFKETEEILNGLFLLQMEN